MNTAMPERSVIVSSIVSIEPSFDRSFEEVLSSARGLTVHLEGEQEARLEPEDPRAAGFARILTALQEQKRPVYLETDPETSAITRLLIPYVSRIRDIQPGRDETLIVELELSHAVHVLPAGSEREQLEWQLREALAAQQPVILTETDDHQIIDVRKQTIGGAEPDVPFARPTGRVGRRRPLFFASFFFRIWWWRCWPWWCWWPWGNAVSVAQADQAFNAMSATSCAPLTVPPPCIPFLYPDDGCWGRAHEMCRLMINMGLSPRKVWIQGYLHAATRNNPNCFVNWGWHVAPTLRVRTRRFMCCAETMVIDPSLFGGPVPEATWKGVQGDPNATLTQSDASDFLWGQTDPTYTQTNQVLATYRLQLQNRSIQQGPPPYANCP